MRCRVSSRHATKLPMHRYRPMEGRYSSATVRSGQSPPVGTGTPSRLPAPLLERLARVAARPLLFLPELHELAVLPAPPALRPLADDVLVLAGLQHLAGDLRPEAHVMAPAA